MHIGFDDYVEGQLNNSIAFMANEDDAWIIVQALLGFYSGDSVTVHVGKQAIHGEAGSNALLGALDRRIRRADEYR
jgi:hypothetical protein